MALGFESGFSTIWLHGATDVNQNILLRYCHSMKYSSVKIHICSHTDIKQKADYRVKENPAYVKNKIKNKKLEN